MEDTNTVEKIKTSTPELHLAAGKTLDQLEVITPGAADAKPAAEAAAAQNQPPAEKPTTEVAAKPAFNPDAISDEDFNRILEKRTNGKFKAIDELNPPVVKTPEEIEAEKQKKKSDARAWALETGKAKPGDYDTAAVVRSKSDRELALQLFTANLQEEDKDITPAEAEEIFKDVHHEGADEKSRLYLIGQKNIKKLAEAYRHENLSKLDEVESLYDEEINTVAQYNEYKGQVKKVAAEMPKEFEFSMDYKYLDGEQSTISYKIPVDEKILAKILADNAAQKSFVMRNISSNGKINEKALSTELQHELKAAMFEKAVSEVLAQHTKEIEKRMEVVLGNKRNPLQGPIIGAQGLPREQTKPNDYSALSRADSNSN